MTEQDKDVNQDVTEQRLGTTERRQSVTEATLEKIGKSLFDSRRSNKDAPEPIRWNGNPSVEMPSNTTSFPGVVWQKGHRYYDPDISTDTTGYGIGGLSTTKLCLKWYVDDSHAPEYTDGPIPSPLPANMEMEYVANLSSAIHVH